MHSWAQAARSSCESRPVVVPWDTFSICVSLDTNGSNNNNKDGIGNGNDGNNNDTTLQTLGVQDLRLARP